MQAIAKRRRSSRRRDSFTLVEMLVVITIIAALLALSISAVMKFIVVQESNNSQMTLNKTQSALNQLWSITKDQAFKEPIDKTVDAYIRQNLVGSTTDANVDGRVRVIYVKLKMRQMFPMNFGEALNIKYYNSQLGQTVPQSPVAAQLSYVNYLNKLGVTANTLPYAKSTNFQIQPYESAACLLMALQTSRGGGGVNAGDIGGGGSSAGFDLTNSGSPGQTIQALCDAWQTPLYFTRVPAGCSLVNSNPVVPGGGTTGIHDPGDPQGYLNSGAWLTTQPANTTLFTQLTLQPLAAGNSSYNLVPMLASPGQNKKLDVDPIWFSGNINDDLFSTP